MDGAEASASGSCSLGFLTNLWRITFGLPSAGCSGTKSEESEAGSAGATWAAISASEPAEAPFSGATALTARLRTGLTGTSVPETTGEPSVSGISSTGFLRASASGPGRDILRLFHRDFSTVFTGSLLPWHINTFPPAIRQFSGLLPYRPLAGRRGRILFRPGRFRNGLGLCRSFRRRPGFADNAFFRRRLRRNLFRSQIWGGIRHGKEN